MELFRYCLAAVLVTLPVAGAAVAAAQDPPDERCPEQLQELPPDGVAEAINTALREASRLYTDAQQRDPVVVKAARADRDDERGPSVETRCGSRGLERNVIVYLEFPNAHSASASEGVLAVALTDGRYRVWFQIH